MVMPADTPSPDGGPGNKWAIAIHGGAGVIEVHDLPALDRARQGLRRALEAGERGGDCGGLSEHAREAGAA